MTDDDKRKEPDTDAEYDVGYKKPPRHTQFKKGQSGNPNGRPKNTRNFTTDVQALLKKPIRLNENGRIETVSTQKGLLLRLANSALKGDARALSQALALAASHNNDEAIDKTDASPRPMDERILKNYLQRHFGEDRSDSHFIDCVENELETTATPTDNPLSDEKPSD